MTFIQNSDSRGSRLTYDDIDLGEGYKKGHFIYPNARDKMTGKRLIVKLNKRAKQGEVSILEVAFGDLAALHLKPYLAPFQKVLVDAAGQTSGVVCEHYCYRAAAKECVAEDSSRKFFMINNGKIDWEAKTIATPEDIPIYFLDKVPSGFFAQLCQMEKAGKLSLDISSLASVLSTSYLLEEDDLHKGNFGFYLVEKDGKPHVVFFKIDYDMMLSDKIMSYEGNARLMNLLHNRHAYDITQRDLETFPYIRDSQNYYYPTTKCYTAIPLDNKSYSTVDINAFIALGEREDFKREAWLCFYKDILLSPKEIAQSVRQRAYSDNTEHDQAQVKLITNADVTRMAQARAVLFSCDSFREVVASLTEDEEQTIIQEILSQNGNDPEEIAERLKFYRSLCVNKVIVQGDTPLHTAIRLGEYRYDETWELFNKFSKTKNAEGQTALEMVSSEGFSLQKSPHFDNQLPINLIQRDLSKQLTIDNLFSLLLSKESSEEITDPTYCNVYFKSILEAKNSQDLITIMGEIDSDPSFSLKFKKVLSIVLIRYFIQTQKLADPQSIHLKPVLAEFQKQMNGSPDSPPHPALKFISQLRTDLWIVRMYRGLFGGSTTKVTINQMINNELIPPFSFKNFLYNLFKCPAAEAKKSSEAADVLNASSEPMDGLNQKPMG